MDIRNPQTGAASQPAASLVFTTITCLSSGAILASSVSTTTHEGLRDALALVTVLGSHSPGSLFEVDQATLPVGDFQAGASRMCAANARRRAGYSASEVQQ